MELNNGKKMESDVIYINNNDTRPDIITINDHSRNHIWSNSINNINNNKYT